MLAPRQRDPNTPFALGDEPRSWGQLLADAAVLARGLPAGAAARRGDGRVRRSLPVRGGAARGLARRAIGGAAARTAARRRSIACAPSAGSRSILHDGGGQGGGASTCARGLNAAARRGSGAGARPRIRARAQAGLRLHVGVHRRPRRVPEDGGAAARRGRAAGAAVGPRARNPRARDGPAPSPLRPAVRRPGPVHGRRQLRPHDAAARRDDRRAGALPSGERAGQRPRPPARGGGAAAGALPPLARIFSSGAPLDAGTAAAVDRAGRACP